MTVELICGDCIEVMRGIADASVDAVITDPPYGQLNCSWDKKRDLDSDAFLNECKRISRHFVAFFTMMPTMLDWLQAAKTAKLRFLEHVIWLKRNNMPGGNEWRLKRGHESILIYAVTDGDYKFYQHKGPFTDVRLPGILFDAFTIDSLSRHVSSLELQARRGRGSRVPGGRGNGGEFDRLISPKRTLRELHSEIVNFTNVWSFLPPGQAKRDGKQNHPTEKPLLVMLRLVEMLSLNSGMVIDPCMGSGTTGVACIQTGRNFLGIEIDPIYFAIAQKRIAAAQIQPALMEVTG